MSTDAIELQLHQAIAATADEPEVALVTGLGGGKTYTGVRWIISRAITYPESIHLVTINSYGQADDTIIPAMDKALAQYEIPYIFKVGKSRPTYWIDVGNALAQIRVRSLENFDSIRGPEYGSWWGDELRDAPAGSIPTVLDRLRCRNVDVARYLWTTTPRGHDDIHNRHVDGGMIVRTIPSENGTPIKLWKKPGHPRRLLIQADTRVNAKGDEHYWRRINANHDAKMADQERGGEFVVLGNRIYYQFERLRNVSPDAVYVRGEPVYVALDFNVTPLVAVIIQERAGRVLVIDEIWLDDGKTLRLIDEFKRRYPGVTPAEVHGDANGWNRDTRSFTSDYQQWRDAFPSTQICVPQANGPIVDRLAAVNGLFANADGAVRCLVNGKCTRFIADCETVVSHPDRREPYKESGGPLTHTSDAFGYYAVAKYPCRVKLDRKALASGDRRLIV